MSTAVSPVTAAAAGARFAFHFDAASCSGCKACQVACRDRHALPPGVQWRRVYEITGGGWRQQGRAWVSDVFAYHLSIACNHCEHPVCVEVCPTGAMRQRADGVVLVDEERCVGCGYCAWACPYGAPQLDPVRGTMTKCTFCSDDVEAGREPACVAACPLRSLTRTPYAPGHGGGDDVPPLPPAALTRPALVLRPHAQTAAARACSSTRVANREELPARTPEGEPSLVAFTLLAQAAAGVVWAAGAHRLLAPTAAATALPLALRLAALLLGAGIMASLLHLGRPRRAWRALANLRTSWLSREILSTGAFGLGLAALVLRPAALLHLLVVLAAAAMVHAMAAVYRVRTIPAWDRPRTTIEFFATAALLGVGTWGAVVAVHAGSAAAAAAALSALLALAVAAAVRRTAFYRPHERDAITLR